MYSYYDKILLTGDFNAEIHDDYLESFLYQHELQSLVKEKSCFKKLLKPKLYRFIFNKQRTFFSKH